MKTRILTFALLSALSLGSYAGDLIVDGDLSVTNKLTISNWIATDYSWYDGVLRIGSGALNSFGDSPGPGIVVHNGNGASGWFGSRVSILAPVEGGQINIQRGPPDGSSSISPHIVLMGTNNSARLGLRGNGIRLDLTDNNKDVGMTNSFAYFGRYGSAISSTLNVGGTTWLKNSTNFFGAHSSGNYPSLCLRSEGDGFGFHFFHAQQWAAGWTWEHGGPAGDIRQMDLAASDNTLVLYEAIGPNIWENQGPQTIKLNPSGTSTFQKPVTFNNTVRVVPQGDLSMGTFTNSPPAP